MSNKLPMWGRVGVMDSNVDKVVKAWDGARNKADKVRPVMTSRQRLALTMPCPAHPLVGPEEGWTKVGSSSIRIEQPHLRPRDTDSDALHGVSTARGVST